MSKGYRGFPSKEAYEAHYSNIAMVAYASEAEAEAERRFAAAIIDDVIVEPVSEELRRKICDFLSQKSAKT